MCITCEPFYVQYTLCRISCALQTEADRQNRQTDRQSLDIFSHSSSQHKRAKRPSECKCLTHICDMYHSWLCISPHACCPGPACTARNTNREAYFTQGFLQKSFNGCTLLSGCSRACNVSLDKVRKEYCRVALVGSNAPHGLTQSHPHGLIQSHPHGLTQSHQLGLRLATCFCKMPLSAVLYVQRHHS